MVLLSSASSSRARESSHLGTQGLGFRELQAMRACWSFSRFSGFSWVWGSHSDVGETRVLFFGWVGQTRGQQSKIPGSGAEFPNPQTCCILFYGTSDPESSSNTPKPQSINPYEACFSLQRYIAYPAYHTQEPDPVLSLRSFGICVG